MNKKKWFVQNVVLPVAIFLGIAFEAIGCTNVVIDWANVIKFGGITYLNAASHNGRAVTSNDIGSLFARVQTKLDGNIHSLNYQLQDGDAAFLDPGTPVYSVKWYRPTFRLVAYDQNHHLQLFEADSNPHAKRGGDLLDIADKVQPLHILKEDGETEIAAITNPTQIARLVSIILAAPVDQNRSFLDEPRDFFSFHLKDGTAVLRAYGTHSYILARGILLPGAFNQIITQVIS